MTLSFYAKSNLLIHIDFPVSQRFVTGAVTLSLRVWELLLLYFLLNLWKTQLSSSDTMSDASLMHKVTERLAQNDRFGVHSYDVNVLLPWRRCITLSQRGLLQMSLYYYYFFIIILNTSPWDTERNCLSGQHTVKPFVIHFFTLIHN